MAAPTETPRKETRVMAEFPADAGTRRALRTSKLGRVTIDQLGPRLKTAFTPAIVNQAEPTPAA